LCTHLIVLVSLVGCETPGVDLGMGDAVDSRCGDGEHAPASEQVARIHPDRSEYGSCPLEDYTVLDSFIDGDPSLGRVAYVFGTRVDGELLSGGNLEILVGSRSTEIYFTLKRYVRNCSQEAVGFQTVRWSPGPLRWAQADRNAAVFFFETETRAVCPRRTDRETEFDESPYLAEWINPDQDSAYRTTYTGDKGQVIDCETGASLPLSARDIKRIVAAFPRFQRSACWMDLNQFQEAQASGDFDVYQLDPTDHPRLFALLEEIYP